MVRYPFQPLLDAGASARQLGISGQTMAAFKDHGMDEHQAEKYAHRMGLFVYDLWPEMVDHRIEDVSRACDECGEAFIPRQRNQRFCSVLHGKRWRQREWQSVRRRQDPEYRERARLYAAEYYATYRERCQAVERERYRRKVAS